MTGILIVLSPLSYSIPNACALGKRVGHDDGVSSMDIDSSYVIFVTSTVCFCYYSLISCFVSNKWLLSGAWDATVKLWELKGVNGSGGVASSPAAEFFDHENSVQSVALHPLATHAAAGGEDGTVMIWEVRSQVLTTSSQISKTGR